MKNGLKTIYFLFLSIVSIMLYSESDYAVTDEMAPWLKMEVGKKAFREREFGTAATIFRKLIESETVYPEAEIWLAAVFEAEGEFGIAEMQYLKALDLKGSLYILEEEISIKYKLAEIYRITGQYGKYELLLLDILEGDDNYSSSSNLTYLNAMLRTLRSSGLNKLVELYRPANKMTLNAHSAAGIFYYKTGRYSESVLHLMLSVLTPFTILNDELLGDDPDYRFISADSVLRNSLNDDRLSEYIDTSGLFKNLYYLAAALYAGNKMDEAREIWRIVYTRPDSGIWNEKAMRQYYNPYIEPLIGDYN